MEESYFSDRKVLSETIMVLSTAGNHPVASLQHKMSLGLASAGRLYETILQMPVISENGGLEWLQEDGNVDKTLEMP